MASITQQHQYSKKREIYITFLLPFLAICAFVIMGEAVLRFYHYLRWDISFIDGQPRKMGGLSSITLDPELGWRATENYRFSGPKFSADGTKYFANISQDVNGFRMVGDLSSGKPRIFVIGDSFTQAIDVSDDKTYYAILKMRLGVEVEVFAYGGGGYGSLQEFMILDKYYDRIKPDLVLWQYSTNDFINNSPDLETASKINNNGMVRPYRVNKKIQYILPKKETKDLRLFALHYCRLCYIAINRLDRLGALNPNDTVETKTSVGQPAHPVFLQAVQLTDEIMEMVRKRAGSVPIVAFVVGTGAPYGPEYAEGLTEISRRHNIILLDGIERDVLTAEKSGSVIRAADGSHWNELGHRIAGESIAVALKELCLLSSCEDRVRNRTRNSLATNKFH